jgi:hypothetical protein
MMSEPQNMIKSALHKLRIDQTADGKRKLIIDTKE